MNLKVGQVEAINIRQDSFDVEVHGHTASGTEVTVVFRDLCPWGIDAVADELWRVVREQRAMFEDAQQRQTRSLRGEQS